VKEALGSDSQHQEYTNKKKMKERRKRQKKRKENICLQQNMEGHIKKAHKYKITV
jgi:hypothetical protein